MDFEIREKSNALVLKAEPGDMPELLDLMERCGGDDVRFLSDLLEHTGWQGNGKLFQVRPEDIGALTDAPLLTTDCDHDDDGSVVVRGTVWWFERYMLEHFGDTLIKHGQAVFPMGCKPCIPVQ